MQNYCTIQQEISSETVDDNRYSLAKDDINLAEDGIFTPFERHMVQ